MTRTERIGFFIASLAAMSVSGCLSRSDWVVAELGSPWPDGWFEMGGSGSAPGVGQGVFADYFRIVLGEDGRPAVAWDQWDGTTHELHVRRWNGTVWEQLGGTTSGAVANGTAFLAGIDLALDAAGEPVVAFGYDLDGIFGVYVSGWVDSTWAAPDAATYSGLARSPALAIDSSNRAVVAWDQWPFPEEHEICLVRQSASGWEGLAGSGSTPGCLSGTAGQSTAPIVALDAADLPIVAWQEYDGSATYVYLRRFDGSAWHELGGSASGAGVGSGSAPSLALDSRGNPWVGWLAGSSVYLRRWTGTAWQEVGGSASGAGISGSVEALSPVLAIGPDDRPVLAYFVPGGPAGAAIYVKHWDGIAWRELDGSASDAGISGAAVPAGGVAIASARDGFCVAWVTADRNVVVRCHRLP